MDELVTVFGGGGFIGRYIVQELLRTGVRVRVAGRNTTDAFFLKPLGGLGQTQFVAADVTRPASVARAVQGSTAVINLVGILGGKLDAVHVAGARNVSEAAQAAGAKAFVQMSAIGADPAGASAYARTKGEGEAAVRAAFPGATILRPSIVFGPEDAFVNRLAGLIAKLPVMPVFRGDARFQPVWVNDVARAAAQAALDPATHAGKTYALGGPQVLSMAALNAWIADAIGSETKLIALPDPIVGALARFGGWLPGAPMTWDNWLMLQHDNVVAPGAAGFAAFGIDPSPIAAVAPKWLVRYRKHGRFSLIPTA
jgi:NADH dehydrogenase